jgi:TonB family protein
VGDNNNSIAGIPFSMSESTPSGLLENVSAGHLSVHVAPSHSADVPFLFEQQQKRIAPAFLASLGSHVAIGFFVLLVLRYSGQRVYNPGELPQELPNQIIWLSQPGPGGGGGGGGNQMKEPPRKAELPGKEKITVPVQKPAQLEPPKVAKNEPNPLDQLNIPAKNLADSTDSLPGAIEAPTAPPSPSQGAGTGGGAGTGRGAGIGPGSGPGLGPGSGGGSGGGVYQPGSGVSDPRLLTQVRPAYTSEAMRARVQGVAMVQCIVRTTGVPSDCQIYKSLDNTFGLDQEALKAVRQWRFSPGTLRGEPVNVQVLIEMSFTLR